MRGVLEVVEIVSRLIWLRQRRRLLLTLAGAKLLSQLGIYRVILSHRLIEYSTKKSCDNIICTWLWSLIYRIAVIFKNRASAETVPEVHGHGSTGQALCMVHPRQGFLERRVSPEYHHAMFAE